MTTEPTVQLPQKALKLSRLAPVIGALVFAHACTQENVPADVPTHGYVGGETCATCHKAEHERWSESHHDLAMQAASEASVLGDFDNAAFSYAGVTSRFYRQDDRFFVETDGPDGELRQYEVAYTFGVEPLQQYLIAFPDGRLQVLSISWDARATEEGGQRWFHLYGDDAVDFQDPLHWTGPLQNWNFMCAECHSTNLVKNYALETDRFSTQWSDVDVSCEACHGPGNAHVTWANGEQPASDDPQIVRFLEPTAWVIDPDTAIAMPQPDRPTAKEIETCARCHSRRSTLSDDYVHGGSLLDTHRLALLDEDLYFPDGQIKDEVFVYGSFLQSKMHAAGVACTDCHDPHSLELKAPGNGVCAQCHLPTKFDTPQHHHHTQASEGARCVNCHMASRTYMTVDPRRDHSFRVPRPDVSTRIDTPNACTQCHDDQTDEWAAAATESWFGERTDGHFGEAIHAARRGASEAPQRLATLIADTEAPAVVRATAVTLLADYTGYADLTARAARERQPLLRLAAAETLDPSLQLDALMPLLEDPRKAVRLAAAARVAAVPRSALRQAQSEALAAALVEYRDTQLFNADRAEANVNLGVLETAAGDSGAAAAAYQRALDRNPHFVPAYINLADLYREAGREGDVEAVLRRGLARVPNSPALLHALGLSLTRLGDYDRALAALRSAYELATHDTQYAYVYAIALNSLDNAEQALTVLRAAHDQRPSERTVLAALATISRDQGLPEEARDYAQKLLELAPNDVSVQRLAESLGVQ